MNPLVGYGIGLVCTWLCVWMLQTELNALRRRIARLERLK